MIDVKDVRVRLHSAQESFGQKDEQRKVANGKLYESHDAICLQFRDDDTAEQMVTHMEIRNGNEVLVRRTGTITSELFFKRRKLTSPPTKPDSDVCDLKSPLASWTSTPIRSI